MKKLLCCCGLLVATVGVRATPLFTDSFNSYSAGNLVGQGTWAQTGASVVSPIQVASGKAVLTTTGQDAYSPLPGGPITLSDGQNFYIGLTLNVASAQTGDYFLHWTPTVGDTSIFIDRVFVEATTGGYLLGWAETSGGATPVYGSTVLSFGTDYRVVVAYHDVAGALNDTGALYVNPFTNPANEGANTPYLTKSWTSTSAENETIASLNFRQGGATAAAGLTVDDLNASLTFSDVTTFTSVPEPTSLSLLGGFGLLAWYQIRRRK
jgi:hypothetical protein